MQRCGHTIFAGLSLCAAMALSGGECLAQSVPPSRDSVLAQMRKVADWQNKNLSVAAWDADWTQAPFFAGLLALSRASGETEYFDIAKSWSIKARWKVK